MKSKEQKRNEAERPCCKCEAYKEKQCHIISEMPIFVPRKDTCQQWRRG